MTTFGAVSCMITPGPASSEAPPSAPAEVVAQLSALDDHVSTVPVGRDEAGVTQHRDVLGDRARGHLESSGEISACVRCL